MAEFTTITDLFKAERRGAPASARLRDAYVNLFNGKGDREDADLVLIDLLTVSGYHMTAEPPPGSDAASVGALYELNGARRVGARIMDQLSWSRRRLEQLQAAIGDTVEPGDDT